MDDVVDKNRIAPRTRVYDWQDPAVVAGLARSMTGLEFLRKLKAGEVAPIQDTLDFRLDDVGECWAIWTLYPGEYQYNPAGMVHGGVISTLLDTAMGVALWTTLPRGAFGSTIELKVNFVRPITVETGPVRCEGRVVHSGRTIGTADGRVTDRAGKLLARTSPTPHGLRVAVGPTGQERRAARCGTSGKRRDAPCRPDGDALRVATGRPPAASRPSTVAPLRSSGRSWRRRPSGRDAGLGEYEKFGLAHGSTTCMATYAREA